MNTPTATATATKPGNEATLKNGQRAAIMVSGPDPDAPYPVPEDDRFEASEPPEKFLSAPDLEAIANLLREKHEVEFRHWKHFNVVFRWKREGGERNGRPTFGKCVKASGLVRHFGECDFVIWLAADLARIGETGEPLTRFQVEALVDHEMRHVGIKVNEKTGEIKPALIPHDIEEFNGTVERYGAYMRDIRRTARAFQQLPLFGDIDDLARVDAAEDGGA